MLETIAAHPRLAKYLDIPLQHASRNVLARMKRGSNGAAFLKMLEKIRRTIPGVSIRTSFIVGFPGETETDFRELCDFVRAAEFDWMGVFSYSDEDASKSFALDDKIDAKTIARRKNALMALQKTISKRKLRSKVGQRLQVMLEGPSKDTDLIWEARLEGMAPEIDGKVYVTEFEGVNDAADLPAPGHPGDHRNHRNERLRPDRPRRRIHGSFRRRADSSSGEHPLPNTRVALKYV